MSRRNVHRARGVRSVEAMTVFCHDISRCPLLTREQEIRLATVNLDPDRSAKMRAMAQSLLVRANVRLAFMIAKRFQGRGLDLPDLVQEGVFGLIRAARDFNPRRNVRFTSYAGHWIKQYITKAITNQARTVRIPSYQRRLASLFVRAKEQVARETGTQEPDEELVLVRAIAMASERSYGRPSPEVVRAGVRALEAVTVSLDSQEDDLSGFTPLARESTVERATHNETLNGALEAMEQLAPREAEVLRLRCGLDCPSMTLTEIGQRWGITRERTRQIEKRALVNLRRLMGQPEAVASVGRLAHSRKRKSRCEGTAGSG